MPLIIENCHVIDPSTLQVEARSIGIDRGLITSVEKLDSDTPSFDGTGLYAIPGLIDMHVHSGSDPYGRLGGQTSAVSQTLLAVENLGTALHHGITSVRDLGAAGDTSYSIQNAWKRGMFTGARPYVAGPVVTATGGHGSWAGVEVDGPADVRALVRRNLAKGSQVIKLMMRSAERRMELRPDELTAAIQEAHWLDVPVAVHANFSTRSIDAAVDARCDTLEHGYAISEDTASKMASQHTYLCSTTAVLQAITRDPETWMRRGGSTLVDRAVEQFEGAQGSFARARRAGVQLIAGTDAGATGVAFDSLFLELETMVQWGASPGEALAAATSCAAAALRSADLGNLQIDSTADIVLLRRNPLLDISACREVEVVMQAGKMIRIENPSRLQGTDSVHHTGIFHFNR